MDDLTGSEPPDSRFAKLPPGRTKRSPEETALHRRRRLMKAMVELVAERGYRAVTLRELVALAGVSNTSFYEQFRSVQDCFLATYDGIVERGIEQARRAYPSEEDARKQLRAGFEKYVEMSVEHPEETRLVAVEVLSLGAVGIARRQRAAEAFEALFRRALEREMARPDDLSELTVRAVVGGILRIFYRRVREGRTAELRECVEPLVDWSLSYSRAGAPERWHLPSAGPMAPSARAAPPADGLGEMWEERPEGIADQSALSQRERIVRAAALVTAERGYARLSIPAITAAAGVSNKTFYQQFTSAEEAFIEALKVLDAQLSAKIGAAIAARWTWPDGVVGGLDALLRFISEAPLFSRVLFIESMGGGGGVLGRLEDMQDNLLAMFNPDAVPVEIGAPLPGVVVEAIVGGVFAVIQREVTNQRVEGLHHLLPELCFFALAPLSVP